MSFQEEDEWLGLGSGFVLDDAFKCTSPLGADTSLQVPMREPSPIAVSPQNLIDFSFGDNSLAVPMREFGYQSGNDPPRLSPVSSSYQSMAPLQNMAYEMSNASMMQEDSYNSFEQPSLVVNGHYQNMSQQVVHSQQGYFQAVSDTQQQQQQQQHQQQQVVSTPHQHQQQTSSGGGNNASGSLVQQILSAPSTRQTPTPQHNRQRPIQPKTQNNARKRGSVNSHSGMSNKSSKVDTSASNTNQTEVRFSMSALTRITEIGAEMAQLQEQQEKLGINNSQRLSELQAQRASILYEALSSQNVGETVLSQVKQVAAAAAPASQPRSTPRTRTSHSSRQTHFESGPESPQYQPQMYLASHNQYPSTSTAQFQEYSSGNGNQAQIVHQQEQVSVRHQSQQRVYRAQNTTTTVYHTPPQLPPGTVYVQNVPQAAQAQFTSSQPTVGEVVRQQHQLRHVSGAQQMIVQQVAAPQVVVATAGQPGTQIRSQILQQSPLPTQIVLAPAVQQPPQVVVVAHRSSPAQAAKRLEEKRASRLSRLRGYFDSLHTTLSNPDTETPFSDLRDVLQRLLPYHAYGEPNFSEEHLEQFDSNYLRTNINLYAQRKSLEKRLRKVFFDEALHSTEAEERNLLLYLDGEYEKRKLEEEKELVKQGNIESFVRESAIVAALRDSDHVALEKPKPATPSTKPSCSKSIMQQYEYHTFDEVPRVLSPYKSPSPFKSPASSIRSPSPCRSPSSIAYSPRIRARNASQSQILSPTSVQEVPTRTRTQSKQRTFSESTTQEKSDVRKPESTRLLPPPLPTVTTRRSTPTRKAHQKGDPSKTSPDSHLESAHEAPSPVEPVAAESVSMKSAPIPSVPLKSTPVPPPPTKCTSAAPASVKSTSMAPSPTKSTPVPSPSLRSAPIAPAVIKSTPVAPASVKPTPVPPLPVKSTLTAPAPVKSTPVPPPPVMSVPVAPASSPVPSGPVRSAHAQSAPVKSTPIAAIPVKSTTVPAPVTRAPVESISVEATALVSAPVEPAMSLGKKEKAKKLDVPPVTSTPGRLPAKKELLCRARQGVPAEMRSPPAHTSIATSLLYNRNSLEDEDSEGSASPELGIDDVIPLPTSSLRSSSFVAQSSVNALQQSRSVPVPPPPPRLPPLQRPSVPLPPPLPQKKEKLAKTPERTSSPLVKQENVKPLAKLVEEKPIERFRFKPQVPRPTPVSPLKPTLTKREVSAEASLVGKDVNCKIINNHAEDKMANCTRPPPIRLKLKLSGKEVYIENNENSEKGGDKKHKKHKKKKKERHKEHSIGVKHSKEKLRAKGHKRLQSKKEKHRSSPQELVAVSTNGVRMKLKFGIGTNSLSSLTPSRDTLPSNESSQVQAKRKTIESQPSTSKATPVMPEAPRLPRLKIRIGSSTPTVVIAPPKDESVECAVTMQSPSTTVDNVLRMSKSPSGIGTPPAPAAPEEPLAVEFSDDSDTEAERLRCATDKALQGMSNLPEMTRSSASMLPWSTQQTP